MHSQLLTQYIEEIKSLTNAIAKPTASTLTDSLTPSLTEEKPVLDLACGNGRNGLYLLENNIPVVFADVKEQALTQVKNSLLLKAYRNSKALAKLWQVDFESNISNNTPSILQPNSYSAVVTFNYLHRALFEQLKDSVISGGLVIYETFNVDQAKFGRPSNPDFLLKKGELNSIFNDWRIIHSFEGIVEKENGLGDKAVAQIVAIKL